MANHLRSPCKVELALPSILHARRFAHGAEHSPFGSQEVGKEFEQYQPRGLYKCYQSLQSDDEYVAQDQQQDVQDLIVDAIGHS